MKEEVQRWKAKARMRMVCSRLSVQLVLGHYEVLNAGDRDQGQDLQHWGPSSRLLACLICLAVPFFCFIYRNWKHSLTKQQRERSSWRRKFTRKPRPDTCGALRFHRDWRQWFLSKSGIECRENLADLVLHFHVCLGPLVAFGPPSPAARYSLFAVSPSCSP